MRLALLPLSPLALALLLSACQTTAPPAPAASTQAAPPPAAPVPAARPSADPAKPVASETARTLAQNCFTCHGPEGKSPGAIPTLARFDAQRIASKLRDFKSGAEPSTVMGRHAKAYSDSEIEAIASYIAGLNKQGAR